MLSNFLYVFAVFLVRGVSTPFHLVSSMIFFMLSDLLVGSVLETGSSSFLLSLVDVLSSVFTFKFVIRFLMYVVRLSYTYISYPGLVLFIEWLLNVLNLTHVAFLVSFYFLLNSTFVLYLTTFTGSLALAYTLVFLPVIFLMNLSVFIYLLEVLAFLVFGIPFDFYNVRFYAKIPFAIFRSVASFSRIFDFCVMAFHHFIAAPLIVFRACIRLPVELLDFVVNGVDDGRLATPFVRHFKSRLVLSFAIFYGTFFPFFFVLFSTVVFGSFFLSLGLIVAQFYFGVEGLTILCFSFLNMIVFLVSFGSASLSRFLHVDFRRFYVIMVQATRAQFSPLGFNVVLPDSGIRRITSTVNFRVLSDADIQVVFDRLTSPTAGQLAFFIFAILVYVLYRLIRQFFSVVKFIISIPVNFLYALLLAFIPFLLPDIIFDVSEVGLLVVVRLFMRNMSVVLRYLRLLNLSYIFGVSWMSSGGADPLVDSSVGLSLGYKPRLSQLFIYQWITMTRRSVIRFVESLDDLRLPEMLQASYRPPSLDSIRSTYVTLQGIGFPVDQSFIDSLDRPEASSYLAEWGSWKNWLLGTSSNALGYHNVDLSPRNWLPSDFFPEVMGYQHSTRVASVVTELLSTARYWTGNHDIKLDDDDFDALVDDTWEAVKPQYADSRLASFDFVYKNWEKKFNMGFGFLTRNKRLRLKQLTRQAVIESFGGKRSFLKAWAEVFKYAQTMNMPSPVFYKFENLKPKKIANKLIRTVVGSAFSHHVMTTVFNYKPNHNYQPWLTPSKVGMPINGQNFNKLWSSLAGHSAVFAGDMTAFDSSQPPPLIRVCQEIRKRGYTLHRDYDRICQLIDISYDMLITQPLAFKNFGDIAFKAQGATTGHSSTTPDNTIMLIANYLFAWRKVTGLRAREFFNFNTLANFGDDHIIGYDPVFGWSPQLAIKEMAKLGTVMRDEAPGQSSLPLPGVPLPPGIDDWRLAKFSFLSKKPLPLTPDVLAELKLAGISVPLMFATCHDRERLLGKIKGEVPLSKAIDVKSSYEALLGYMDLTAHHHDIYIELAKLSMGCYNRLANDYMRQGKKLKSIRKPPSYNQVLRTWYNGEVFDPDMPLTSEGEDLNSINLIVNPDPFGYFIRWLSDFPTLLSPRYRNVRWADWIQSRLSSRLSWPITFISLANGVELDPGVARSLSARTPYAFLRHELLVPSSTPDDFTVLWVRHLLFLGFQRLFIYRKWFSLLDLVRLADFTFINALFMFTGKVSQGAVELDLHVLETLFVFVLSFIDFVPPFDIPVLVRYIPPPSALIAQFITFAFGFLSPAGSIDKQPLDLARLRQLEHDPSTSFVLQAGTGVGKSTRLVNSIQSSLRRPTVVIVPRASVALGVYGYMDSLYPHSGIQVAVEGHTPTAGFRICYTTVQSFFIHAILRDKSNLFILDEAHIEEPHYMVAHIFFAQKNLYRIWMTATPGGAIARRPHLILPSVNQFSVHRAETSVESMAAYIRAVVYFANDRTSLEKILIFVPTIKNMDEICGSLAHKFCRLNSQERLVDNSASVYIATSVADAGITIPDVSFVISPQFDVTVLNDGVTSSPVYFKLSSQTITQRAGRTGRTSNGAFLLITVEGLELRDRVVYDLHDYLLALRPAVLNSFPYFPTSIKKKLSPDHQKVLAYWDDPRANPSLVAFNTWVSDGQMVSAMAGLDISDVLEVGGATSFLSDGVWSGPKSKDVDPVTEYWPNQTDPFLFVPSPEADDKVQSQSHAFRRVNVSGKGLLCGARVLIGVLYTHLGYRVSDDLMVRCVHSVTIPELLHLYQDFFDFLQLRAVGLQILKVRLRLVFQGVPSPDPLEYNDFPNYPYYTIYLDNGHYNYLGLDYTQAPIEDDRFDLLPPS